MSKFFDLSGAQKTLSVFLSVVLSLVIVAVVAQASSTISTNIQTDGTLSVTGVTTLTGLTTALNASTTVLSNVGTAYFGGSATTTVTSVGWIGVGSSTPWGQFSVNPSTLGSGVPEFVVGSSTATRLIINGTGNVGIGTLTPTSLFHVAGAGYFSGNVGIGTTSPYTSLAVAGATGVLANIFAATSTTATSTFSGGVTISSLGVTGTASSSALIVGSGTSIARILAGTCNPEITAGRLPLATSSQPFQCTVTGAVSGDKVFVSLPSDGGTLAGTFPILLTAAKASSTADYIEIYLAHPTDGVSAAATSSFALATTSVQYMIVR